MSTRYALVIEDDPDLAAIFSAALRAAGFEVETVPAVSAALTCLNASKPDVVTLDLHLAGARGDKILRVIRSEPRLAGTRVIVTTADSEAAEAIGADADLVLIKPISFGQLRDLALRLMPPG